MQCRSGPWPLMPSCSWISRWSQGVARLLFCSRMRETAYQEVPCRRAGDLPGPRSECAVVVEYAVDDGLVDTLGGRGFEDREGVIGVSDELPGFWIERDPFTGKLPGEGCEVDIQS